MSVSENVNNDQASTNTQRNGDAPRGDAWEHEADRPPGILLSTVTPQRVEWLSPGRIPLSKLTIIDGDPGLGKSVLTLELAARVSRGLAMPGDEAGDNRDPADVVILSAEDGIEDTIVPRLDAAGADRSRIRALNLVPDSDGGQRLPSLPLDAPYVESAVRH